MAIITKYIPTDNAILFCQILGKGKPILILHGGAGDLTSDYLLPSMEPLANLYQLVLYDQRGLGRSTGDITAEQINLNNYVADIEAIRKALDLDKISLLGHSFGGLLAMLYSLAYPQNVDRIILSNSMVVTSKDLASFIEEFTRRTAHFSAEIQRHKASPEYQAGDPETVKNIKTQYYTTYFHNPKLVSKLHLLKSNKENVVGERAFEIFRWQIYVRPFDYRQEIKQIQCPTLIIHGSDDVIPYACSEHIHQHIPRSTLVKIDKCGHFPFIEQPDAYFQTITSFLTSGL